MKLLQLSSALMLGLLCSLAGAAPVLNQDYRQVDPPQTPAVANKIEVVEFFSYACPHCYEFEPSLQAWLKKKPADVEYRMVPMVFRENWKALAKLFYTLEAMGQIDQYHARVYQAIYKNGQKLEDDQAVKKWAAAQGLDANKFAQTYDSFGIDSKLQRSLSMGRGYGVRFTPSVAVNGKYITGPSMTMPEGAAGYDRFFVVLDELIAMERGKPAAPAKPATQAKPKPVAKSKPSKASTEAK